MGSRINANVENHQEVLEEKKVYSRHKNHSILSRLKIFNQAENALLANINKWKPPESWRTYIPSSIVNKRSKTIMLSDDPRMMVRHSYETKLEPCATEE